MVVVPLLALFPCFITVYAQDLSSVALIALTTTTGIDYVLPKDLLDILNSAAVLTAFYRNVDKSVVTHLTSQSSHIVHLPSEYQFTSAPTVQLGAVLEHSSSPRELLISSFIPFSWDDMNGYFSIYQVLIQNNAIKTMSLGAAVCHQTCSSKSSEMMMKALCGCFRKTETVVASAAVVAIGSGLDPASCPPKSQCSKELQQVVFDTVNTLVLQLVIRKWYSGCKWSYCKSLAYSIYAHVWPSDLPIPPPSSSKEQSHRRQQSSSSSRNSAQQRARQSTWAQDQLNKNTKNKAVKKKPDVIAAALRGLQTTATSSSSGGVSIAFSTQLNTILLTIASGGYYLPDPDVVVSVLNSAFAGLSSQIAKSAQKLMTTGYLDEDLNTVKASSPFVKALASGTAVAGGITDTTFTVIQADMSDVGISDIYGTAAPTPTSKGKDWLPQPASPTPLPVRLVVPSPTLMPIRPSPKPSSAPLSPPTRAPMPAPSSAPVAKPSNKPVARRPTRRPTKRPTRHPTPGPASADDDEYYEN